MCDQNIDSGVNLEQIPVAKTTRQPTPGSAHTLPSSNEVFNVGFDYRTPGNRWLLFFFFTEWGKCLGWLNTYRLLR